MPYVPSKEASQSSESITSDVLLPSPEQPTNGKAHRAEQEDEIAGVQMRRAVAFSRVLIMGVLASCTIGVAVGVYYYVSKAEDRAFENQFEDDSRKVFESMGSTLDFTLGSADSFVVNEVSYARSLGWTWPFVTFPDFAVSASKLRSLTKAAVVSQYPLVEESERAAWENYTTANDGWVDKGLQVQLNDENFEGTNIEKWTGLGQIHGNEGYHDGSGPYLPTWQAAPVVPAFSPYNWDIKLHYPEEIDDIMVHKRVVIGKTDNLPPDGSLEIADSKTVQWISGFIGEDESPLEPLNVFYYPILSNANEQVKNEGGEDELLGVLTITGFWRDFVTDILPPGSNGIIVVFQNDCGQQFSYQIWGPDSVYLGGGDRHDEKYSKFVKSSDFADFGDFSISDRQYSGVEVSTTFCRYSIHMYPSDEMKNQFESKNPLVYAFVSVAIFLITTVVFLAYDILNQARQRRIMRSALQTNALVSSLFPDAIRDRLLSQPSTGESTKAKTTETPKARLQSYLRDGTTKALTNDGATESSPIAEYFQATTVLFADISGFTSWSSVREPGQVFTLLEAIYGAFDDIANRRGVFKVETIGDSYVAVCGLPEKRSDHAVVMARFARDCREKMHLLTRTLDVSLGPGTSDLQLRFGLNSGPVTAGVLRGQRARFQLFGDTVNTAARMESTGVCSKIHASQSTVDLIIALGKGHWVTKRDDEIDVKGKGVMQTYWIEPQTKSNDSQQSSSQTSDEPVLDDKKQRLVNWNVDILSRSLCRIIAQRETRRPTTDRSDSKIEPQGFTLDEVKEIIELPAYDIGAMVEMKDPDTIELDADLVNNLRGYVTAIASMYHTANSFHNFEHASHVTMSVSKLLSRIVAPDAVYDAQGSGDAWGQLSILLHDHTYGIASDPLTQFACIFSALIHDVDHPGVPNTQLVAQSSPMAHAYANRSVAEQNSIDIAWALLNEDAFTLLRRTICRTKPEMVRFRQLVVNAVMATDIMDKNLKQLRNSRWDMAFVETARLSADRTTVSRTCVNRKATIVIEHLLQASDVAHTMQHWHIYRKWNERLFEESYVAFLQGQGNNPTESWYQGELGFFDYYILPLAKKLRDCGVFGVSSDEYLNYAEKNRDEWERKGREVVATMVETTQHKFPHGVVPASA